MDRPRVIGLLLAGALLAACAANEPSAPNNLSMARGAGVSFPSEDTA